MFPYWCKEQNKCTNNSTTSNESGKQGKILQSTADIATRRKLSSNYFNNNNGAGKQEILQSAAVKPIVTRRHHLVWWILYQFDAYNSVYNSFYDSVYDCVNEQWFMQRRNDFHMNIRQKENTKKQKKEKNIKRIIKNTLSDECTFPDMNLFKKGKYPSNDRIFMDKDLFEILPDMNILKRVDITKCKKCTLLWQKGQMIKI